jgi:hypothetical protein
MFTALLFSALLLLTAPAFAQQPALVPTDEDLSIQEFLTAVEVAISTTDREAWLTLLSPNADRDAATEFFDSMVPQGVTRAVVRERDRTDLMGALPGEGYRLVAEIFIETGARGRILTWRLDVRRPRESDEPQPWRLISQERLSSVEGLHRLTLHPSKQFTATDVVIRSIDFELRLPAGDVFVAETAEGVTTLVLVGDGTLVFTPQPPEERGQLRIFAGTEALDTPFTAAYVRLNPYEFDQLLKRRSLTPASVDNRSFRRAQLIFDEDVQKSFSLDLSDFSRDTWSLLPQAGDLLAEVRTRRFANLTYARSTGEVEDVTLFHRGRKKNIAVYASPMKLSSRGRFFNEDNFTEYDVLHYDIDAAFSPEREWLEARARLRLRVKAYALAALTLKLHERLNVRSVTSDELGRLLFLRVRNQNSIVINLPSTVTRDLELTLDVTYQGPMHSQGLDSESIDVPESFGRQPDDLPFIPPEKNWLFSNRSYWYPQGQVTDYATSNVSITVPGTYAAVASGVPAAAPTFTPSAIGPPRATYTFTATLPARYIGLVVSKMNRIDSAHLALEVVPAKPAAPPPNVPIVYLGSGVIAAKKPPGGIPGIGERNTLLLGVVANRRQEQKGRDTMGNASEILRFYASIVGDAPYDAMTIAMVESHLPGGHSPAYFAMLNNPSPLAPFTWRNDPAAFNNYPEFYLAHELAHQWWGQAVGWHNYHEQWLSEGIAQYFAALYAKERRGEQAFRDVIRQFRRWALDQSDQGPIYLGYRLGHLKNDTRVFRAVVYNKGAGVLHMLRRLVGDDAFFRGLRRFYADNRYKKAGTMDLRRAMEAESGRSLERFFERWIFESGIPRLRYSTSVEGQELVVRVDQLRTSAEGPLYDVPLTITLNYADKTVENVIAVTEATVEKRIPLAGALKNVDVNDDGAAIAVVSRQ